MRIASETATLRHWAYIVTFVPSRLRCKRAEMKLVVPSADDPPHPRAIDACGSAPGSGVAFKVRLLLLLHHPHGVRETDPGNSAHDAALIDLCQRRRGCKALIALAVEEIRDRRHCRQRGCRYVLVAQIDDVDGEKRTWEFVISASPPNLRTGRPPYGRAA